MSYTLAQVVIHASVANDWFNAVQEWEIYDCIEDNLCESSCICGKEHIKYLYTIRNRQNGNALHPIGSTCIKKFGRIDLNDEISVIEGLFYLLHAIRNHEFIELNAKYFSRKLITYLYNEGVFDNDYNNYDGVADYEFFLKMFNKRDKDTISYKQRSKIRAIIVNSIRPYLEEQLANKIKQ
ncbi:MAG: hypothetical protein K2M89_04250 [Clostridiales bacterium]|nr:hypothetical protein [Clostridiales bacterium]